MSVESAFIFFFSNLLLILVAFACFWTFCVLVNRFSCVQNYRSCEFYEQFYRGWQSKRIWIEFWIHFCSHFLSSCFTIHFRRLFKYIIIMLHREIMCMHFDYHFWLKISFILLHFEQSKSWPRFRSICFSSYHVFSRIGKIMNGN